MYLDASKLIQEYYQLLIPLKRKHWNLLQQVIIINHMATPTIIMMINNNDEEKEIIIKSRPHSISARSMRRLPLDCNHIYCCAKQNGVYDAIQHKCIHALYTRKTMFYSSKFGFGANIT